MFGRADSAMTALGSLPSLVDPDGRNPAIVRALRLSWDALLIAGALSFLLGELSVYRLLRAAVVAANNVPASARWSFCLPEPDCDLRDYVSHECESSSNICTIVCEIASKTRFGRRSFYTEDQQPPPPLFPPPRDLAPPKMLPRLPAYVQPPNIERRDESGHSFGYGAGGMAMRVPDPSSGCSGSGGRAAVADLNDGAPDTPKRRKVMSGGYAMCGASAGLMAPSSPPQATPGDAAMPSGGASSRDYHGPREFGAFGDRVADDEGLGLTRGFHNMSLTRLSVPQPIGELSTLAHEPVEPLGPVSSDSIMDVTSTIGSFPLYNADSGSFEDVGGGENHDGAAGGDGRRSGRRLSSFLRDPTRMMFSPVSLGQFSGMSRLDDPLQSAASTTGSDLGQDVVVVGDDFLENNDICDNSLLVAGTAKGAPGPAGKESCRDRFEPADEGGGASGGYPAADRCPRPGHLAGLPGKHAAGERAALECGAVGRGDDRGAAKEWGLAKDGLLVCVKNEDGEEGGRRLSPF